MADDTRHEIPTARPSVRRRDFLRIASASGAALAIGGVLPGRAFAQRGARTLKIGYVSPQTGPLAGFGETDNFVLSGVRKAAPSLRIKGHDFPVETLVRDSQSDPNRAGEVASRLILSDKVDLMLVASTPETTNPVSDQCEVNSTPCVSTVAPWQPWFFARGGKPDVGFKSTYHFLGARGHHRRVPRHVEQSAHQQGGRRHLAQRRRRQRLER